MKRLVALSFIGLVALTVGCSASQRAQTKVQRKPLEKQRREYKTPTKYDPRDLGYDPKTGKLVTYDHKPRVELTDEKAGKYAFKWIGYDGKEKAVVFQRGDVLDVVVSADVSKTSGHQYMYTYTAQNLPTSATYLKRLIVQNLAADVMLDKGGPFMPFTMSNTIFQFREGNWISFDDVSDDVQIDPGQQVQVRLTSSAPPGLVECRASIETVINGAGEEMPSALENLLPGYDDFPKGYTIGPVDYLKALSPQDRIKYVLGKLPQFHALGWMTDESVATYEQLLKRGDLNQLLTRLDQDVSASQITTEVRAIIRGTN